VRTCSAVFALIWKDLEKPEVELEYRKWKYRKWISIICVIKMLGSMHGSMPEVVQTAEIQVGMKS